MQADEHHHDVIARTGDVEVRVLRSHEAVTTVVALLDRAEQAAGAPLVDESERARLEAVVEGGDRSDLWHGVVAVRHDRAVGYAGLVLPSPEEGTGMARGDVAVDRDATSWEPALVALLAAVDALGRRHDARRLEVWLRHATDPDLRCASRAGYHLDRRLGVLARALEGDLAPDVPDDVVLDHFRDADADAVVDVLAAAYAGTPDGGWTREDFDHKRGYDWFDPTDLLVARSSDGGIVGVHWTKRRDDRTGEVYNLAVHPEAQGGRLGATLLRAGLAHLRDAGCREVMLWVDLANDRAVRLYMAAGFDVRWEDVALGRSLGQASSTSRLRSASGTSL